MTELQTRIDAWLREHDNPESPATLAATVVMLRDSADGPEVLMVQRNAKGTFASAWVFPGGKVDPDDFGDDRQATVLASQTAACREAQEEADLVIDAEGLVAFSHWMPPGAVPRRFATWFFLGHAPSGTDGEVNIDGGEIVDHLWVRPEDALVRHAAGEVQLVPPTWVTLTKLASYDTAADAVTAADASEPDFYVTRMIPNDPPTVLWHGDAAYETDDLTTPGPRHRLEMAEGAWLFQEPAPPA